MKNYSIWSEEIKSTYEKLDKDLNVDILIIGGGMTGVNVAYQLMNSNMKVCLVEKNVIGSGVTSRTTGKLTFLQEDIYSKLKFYHGDLVSKFYLESQKDAIKLAQSIIDKENIDCNLESVKSFIINNNDKKFIKENEVLKSFDVMLNYINKLPNGENKESFYVDDTYVFHPIKYLNSLVNIVVKNGVIVYENTKVIEIDKKDGYYFCKANNSIIKCKYIIFALHYPYFLIPFLTPFKTKLEKSYIRAKKVDNNYKYSSITISKPTVSTRYISSKDKHYQIYLTNSHNLCIRNNESKEFREFIKDNPDYVWSNKDILTNDYLPFIGSINEDSTLLIGTGYNTWGMTNGILAGKILSDIILKKENKYIPLFDPKRCLNIGKIINTPIIIGSNAYFFIKSKVSKNKSWYGSNVRFEKRNGKDIAIYIDEKNKEHIVYNICPHLKCGLIFNEVELTWDCPCHGSRFDIDGKCIEGPSNYDISYKN